MGRICEHMFERKNQKTKYSLVEYDLYAKLNMTLVKNHETGRFEIIGIRENEGRKFFEGTLEEIVDIANKLEGAENTKVECVCRK